jgi:hypothetical protein
MKTAVSVTARLDAVMAEAGDPGADAFAGRASGRTPVPEPAVRPPLPWCSMLTVRLLTSVVG